MGRRFQVVPQGCKVGLEVIMEVGGTDERVLVVAGRAPDIAHFVKHVREHVFDNFNLAVATPVEEELGIDGQLRFIGFIVGRSVDNLTIDNQAMVLKSDTTLGAVVYDDMDAAIAGAKERYGYDDGSAALAERAERMKEISERFTTMTAAEVEYASIFESLMGTGRLTLVRGIIDDTPVCCWAMVSTSEAETEVKMQIMAVLVTHPKIAEMIELPFSSLGG